MPKSPRFAAYEGSKSYLLDVRLFAEWIHAGFGALRILIASPARDANGADDLAVDNAVARGFAQRFGSAGIKPAATRFQDAFRDRKRWQMLVAAGFMPASGHSAELLGKAVSRATGQVHTSRLEKTCLVPINRI